MGFPDLTGIFGDAAHVYKTTRWAKGLKTANLLLTVRTKLAARSRIIDLARGRLATSPLRIRGLGVKIYRTSLSGFAPNRQKRGGSDPGVGAE